MDASVIAFGALAASGAHVLTGPDHMAAVLPLAVEHRGRAPAVGAWWGLGHGIGVVAIGGLARLAIDRATLTSIAGACEVVVGVLLVILGIRAVRAAGARARGDLGHHRHEHHHAHAHRGGPLGFGILHGAAGGGHVFGVLPSLALDRTGAALYLAVYLVGAVLAMSAFASLCGRLVPPRAVARVLYGGGLAAVTVGLFWIGAAFVAA